MNSKSWLMVLGLASSMGLCSCITDGAGFAIQGGLFRPEFTGDAALSSDSGGDGTPVDFNNELNLDETELTPYARIDANFFGFYVSASGFRTSQDGTGLLTANFGDINAGANIDSEIDLMVGRAEIGFSVLDVGFLRITPGLGVDYVDLDLSVEEPVTRAAERVEVRQPIPLIILQIEIDPDPIPIQFILDAGGIWGTFDDVDGAYFDIEAFVRVDVFSPLTAWLGYRHIMFSLDGTIDGESFDTDLTLSGFMGGIGLAF